MPSDKGGNMADLNYKVYNRDGRLVMQAPEICRYDKKTERSLLESGHKIRLNGRLITKKDI